jgi:hypothetical protein
VSKRADAWREFVDSVGVTKITRTNSEGVVWTDFEAFNANHPSYSLVMMAFYTGFDGGVMKFSDCGEQK